VLLVIFALQSLIEQITCSQLASHPINTITLKKINTLLKIPSKEDLVEFNRTYLKPLLIQRVSGTEGNRIAREFIVEKLKAVNWHVELDSFEEKTPLGIKPFVNIIATYNISAPRKLILAAHYDSKYFKNMKFIGATDSAAACALLLELVHHMTPYLANQKRHRDVTLQLVFFDGEEAFVQWTKTDSIYGARHLAEKWSKQAVTFPVSTQKVKKESELHSDANANVDAEIVEEDSVILETKSAIEMIDALVLLDLIGYREPVIINFFDETVRLYERAQRIEKRLREKNLTNTENLPSNFFPSGGMRFKMNRIEDDHVPFLKRGVPVFHVIPMQFPEVWHQVTDDGTAVDLGTLDDFSRIMKVFLVEYFDLDVK